MVARAVCRLTPIPVTRRRNDAVFINRQFIARYLVMVTLADCEVDKVYAPELESVITALFALRLPLITVSVTLAAVALAGTVN